METLTRTQTLNIIVTEFAIAVRNDPRSRVEIALGWMSELERYATASGDSPVSNEWGAHDVLESYAIARDSVLISEAIGVISRNITGAGTVSRRRRGDGEHWLYPDGCREAIPVHQGDSWDHRIAFWVPLDDDGNIISPPRPSVPLALFRDAVESGDQGAHEVAKVWTSDLWIETMSLNYNWSSKDTAFARRVLEKVEAVYG